MLNIFNSGSRVKELSKIIITDFTVYVRDAIKSGRMEYKLTGIDEDLLVYRNFFLKLLALSLGLEEDSSEIDERVKTELISLIRRDLSYRRFYKMVQTNHTRIYAACEVAFDSVVKGILESGKIENR